MDFKLINTVMKDHLSCIKEQSFSTDLCPDYKIRFYLFFFLFFFVENANTKATDDVQSVNNSEV